MYWGRLGAGVPQKDLSRVCAADDKVRVEGREFGSEDVRLGVEDVFGSVVHVHVPDLNQTIRIVRSRGVLGVGR